MRIGILTFPGSPSFGASLQMTALYYALKKEKVDVEIINYMNLYMLNKKHFSTSMLQRLKSSIANLLSRQGAREFKKFEEEITLFPKAQVHDVKSLKKLSSRYDFVICGSDQVWNPLVTGFDLSYLFSFLENDYKKIAYAASFGLNDLPTECIEDYRRELKKFHRISVREERGQEIVKELVGQKCDLVIDPSMLLTRAEWERKIVPYENLPQHYIVKFIFNYNKEVEESIEELQKKTGLPILTIGGTFFSKFKNELFTGAIGPQKWLYIIKNADYVVTDSFHGAAFSIIFEKNLFVSLKSSTNSRLVTLCNNFGLNDRIVPNNSLNSVIDYTIVNEKMKKMREESLAFLREAIGK